MSRYLLPVLLSLLGCAGPAQYERGTMRPPARVPTFNPTTDSPNPYGHPRSEVPRSPHGRVLPQTPETRKEPGIWASEVPPGAVSGKGPILLLGVTLPHPDDIGTENDRHTAALCAATMGEAVKQVDVHDTAQQLTPEGRACLASVLYMTCAQRLEEGIAKAKAGGHGFQVGLLEHIRSSRRIAEALAAEKCKGVIYSDDFADFAERIVARWTEMTHGM